MAIYKVSHRNEWMLSWVNCAYREYYYHYFPSVIREMLRIESTIDSGINRLTERVRLLSPDPANMNDDVESVTSADGASFSLASSSKLVNRHLSHVHKETECLKSKVKSLEQENLELRKKLDQLQQALGQAVSI